jgi:tRNA-Thr(GGU) m(6)t(6)A37 methyltransferase TsaA
MIEFKFKPIGTIYSPFTEKEQTPIQASRSQTIGEVEVFAEFADGLAGLEEFSHIFLIYAFHCSSSYQLLVKPFLDDQSHGLFSTRFPQRPNPVGLSVVRLLARRGNRLEIEGVDVLDGTPLLDIKPYVPDFDVRENVQTGWYARRSKE